MIKLLMFIASKCTGHIKYGAKNVGQGNPLTSSKYGLSSVLEKKSDLASLLPPSYCLLRKVDIGTAPGRQLFLTTVPRGLMWDMGINSLCHTAICVCVCVSFGFYSFSRKIMFINLNLKFNVLLVTMIITVAVVL